MHLKDLDIAINLIDENNGDFEGSKSSELIEKSEKALNLKFPPTYRKFLKILGCGNIEGIEFYGIIDDDFEESNIPNAIWLTLNERKSGLPKEFILICSNGDGSYYAIDTSKIDDNGENPIIYYGIDGSTKKMSDNFGSFLLSELKAIL